MSEDIDIGKISEALNDKADRDLKNVDITGGADSVIEYKMPTDDDPTWYRKYASGWVEQGGEMDTSMTVNLVKEMKNIYYYVDVTWNGGKSQNFYAADGFVRDRTTTSFTTSFTTTGANVKGLCWIVKGLGV